MDVKERVIDVDEFWRFVCQPENADRRLELINGEIIEMPRPSEKHGYFAGEVFLHFRLFDPHRRLGIPAVDAGYYSLDDRHTVLAPDVAFRRTEQGGQPPNEKWAPQMPDIAVEVQSPSNTVAELRRKAAIFLNHGTSLVWIVIPKNQTVEVCRLDDAGQVQTEVVDIDGSLSGEQVLPGFRLPLHDLFT